MASDPFASSSDSLIAPARTAFAIMPSDTTSLPKPTKAIYVGSGGDLTVRLVGAPGDVTFKNVVSGTVLAIRISAIRETGTTVADLVGLA